MKQTTEHPTAGGNAFGLPTKENPNPANYPKWMNNCRFMEYNPEDAHCVMVIDKCDLPEGATIGKVSKGSGTLQAKGQSNLFAEIIATFCNLEGGREKKQAWARDLIAKPENYLTSKDRDFIASNIEWDWKRLLKELPAGSINDDERTIFNLTNDRLKVILSAAKMELSKPKKAQNTPDTSNNSPEWTSEDIPF